MDTVALRRIFIKKIDLLISKNIGDKSRLESIQMKAAQALPLLVENEAYVDSLILDYLSDFEIESIKNEVKTAQLQKSNYDSKEMLHCICCGNIKKSLDNGGMCTNCYLDYNIKISKFITKPTGRSFF